MIHLKHHIKESRDHLLSKLKFLKVWAGPYPTTMNNIEEEKQKIKERKRTRLKNYDYSRSGYYFVTICTHNRINRFGEIVDSEMILNEQGNIVNDTWIDLSCHHQGIYLDEYIIMPNHVHGIVIIERDIVGAGPARPAKSSNLSTIIGSFKSSATRQINAKDNGNFRWQRSFYDHVIRNEKSLNQIREYIIDNPANWDHDEDNIINHSKRGQAGPSKAGAAIIGMDIDCLAPTKNIQIASLQSIKSFGNIL